MNRCIIHFGMHKTGSTSIQRSLHGFDDEHFLYADLGKSPNHSLAIYSQFARHPEQHHLHKANDRNGEALRAYLSSVRDDMEHAIAASRERTLIISGEDIGSLAQDDLVKLRDFFQSRFDHLSVVGYVRPPAGFMSSVFQQRMKGGSVSQLEIEQQYPDYEMVFNKFDAVFGCGNVQLWKFDPQSFPHGCVVQDFCSRLGIALPIDRIVRLNESLSRQAVAMLYTYRKLGRKYGAMTIKGPDSMKLGNLLSGIEHDKFRFSPEVVRPVLEKKRTDIEWMEARLGQSLHEALGEHRPGDVRSEADLLTPDPAVVGKLLSLLGDRVPAGVTGETPEQVALLVHALRCKWVPGAGVLMRVNGAAGLAVDLRPCERGETQMKVDELIEQIQQTNPKLLEGIPAKRAAALVRHLFRHMNETLAGTEEGVVKFVGLGQFRVKVVEREVDGAKVSRTQIGFRRAEPGQEKKHEGVEAVAEAEEA